MDYTVLIGLYSIPTHSTVLTALYTHTSTAPYICTMLLAAYCMLMMHCTIHVYNTACIALYCTILYRNVMYSIHVLSDILYCTALYCVRYVIMHTRWWYHMWLSDVWLSDVWLSDVWHPCAQCSCMTRCPAWWPDHEDVTSVRRVRWKIRWWWSLLTWHTGTLTHRYMIRRNRQDERHKLD